MNMSIPLDRLQPVHVVREVAISMAINAAFSAFFVFLMFSGSNEVPIWGLGGAAFDFIPQTFAIALMATLIPTVIVRKAMRKAALSRSDTNARAPRHVLPRALLIAAVVTCAAVPLAVAAIAVASGPIAFGVLLPVKVTYGAFLAGLVTSFAIRAALREGVSE